MSREISSSFQKIDETFSKKTEKQLKKRDKRNLERLKFSKKQKRIIDKINKMCTNDVQQEFLSMKDLINESI